jgi:hypothetical protein
VYKEKILVDSRILKGGRVTILKKVRGKLSVKWGFLTLLTNKERLCENKET